MNKFSLRGGIHLKRNRINHYGYPKWVRNVRNIGAQFAIPFCVFQGIRTLLFPTTLDVLLLAVLILIALAIQLNMI